LQPELDHVKAIGNARSECLLEAYEFDAQPLSPETIDEILLDAVFNMDSAANTLIGQKSNEMQSARPIPSCYSDTIPEPLELSSWFAEVQHEAKDALHLQLNIRMGREHLASKAKAFALLPSMSQTFNFHGHNTRVNFDSIDKSINVIRRDAPFDEVRKAIEEGIADRVERTSILEKLADLERATDKETGAAKYAAFIAVAANHVQVILPFLPLLMDWAGKL